MEIITILVVAMTLLNLGLRVKIWQKRGLQDKTDLFYITSYVFTCAGLVNLTFIDRSIPNWLSFSCFGIALIAVVIGLGLFFLGRYQMQQPVYRSQRNVLR